MQVGEAVGQKIVTQNNYALLEEDVAVLIVFSNTTNPYFDAQKN